jgi:hypothetical protein
VEVVTPFANTCPQVKGVNGLKEMFWKGKIDEFKGLQWFHNTFYFDINN